VALIANRRLQILVGLVVFLGLSLLPLGSWGRAYSGLGDMFGGELPWWIMTVLLLLYVAVVEKRRFSSLGFRTPGWRDIALAVGAAILAISGISLTYAVIFPMFHLKLNSGAAQSLLDTPFWFRVLLVTRAAVAEELIFRGYGFSRSDELTGSRLAAALLTWVVFTVAHVHYWGAAQLIVAGWGGLVLTLLFLWRRNLWANMLAHWLTDAAGFLLPH
jgi:membrane protease YdiL (CAAX protease family)